MGPLLDDIKAKGVFFCHCVLPPCSREPYAEVQRVGKNVSPLTRSLFCAEHAREYAAKGGFPFPEPEEN